MTGATGFVGRRVVAALEAAGFGPLRCLVHRPRLASVLNGHRVELVQGEMLDSASLRAALQGVQTVIHLVSIIREKGRYTFRQVNWEATRTLTEEAKKAGVRRFIYMSALGARDDPHFRYAYSKWQAEQEVARSGIPYTILRPSILFGEGDEFFNTLAALVRLLPIVPVAGDGRARFQPLSVEDLARCLPLVLTGERFLGQVVEMGGPEQMTYDQIVDLLAQTLGLRRWKVHIPVPLMRLLALAMEALLPRPPVTREQLRYLALDNTTAPGAFERWFGFRPRPVQGNIGYIRRLRRRDALRILLGIMPRHICDH